MTAFPAASTFAIRPKAARALLTVGVFAIIGPPVGGIVAWLGMGAATARAPWPFIAGSYGEGMLLAAATGALVAAAAWFGRASWLVAVGAALAVNAVVHLAAVTQGIALSEQAAALMRIAGVFLPSSLVAAIACWLVARRFWVS